MVAAELVDPQLRASVRGARSNAVRCLKAIIVGQSVGVGNPPSDLTTPALGSDGHGEVTLALGSLLHEDLALSMEEEFERCVEQLIEDDKPCLLLFRADGRENIEGSRWLLVAWMPKKAPDADRAAYMRSRGLLSDLVSQPYFLREYFAHRRLELKWRLVCSAVEDREKAPPGSSPPVGLGCHECTLPDGPIALGASLVVLLQRFMRKEDLCLRLNLIGSKTPVKWAAQQPGSRGGPDLLILDAKTHDCKNVLNLAKSGLPSSVCFFVTFSKDDLVFVHWCPDMNLRKDAARAMEEARYAVLKRVVLQTVLKACTNPPERVIQIDAREQLDIHEGVIGRAVDSTSSPLPLRGSPRPADLERSWPSPGSPADWPWDWPAAASGTVMPSSLVFPERHVPHWRGGSKMHTIGTESGAPLGARRHKSVKFRD